MHNEIDAKSGFIILTNNSGENFEAIINTIVNIREGRPYEMPKKSVYKEMAKRTFENNVNDAIDFYHNVKTDTVAYDTSEFDINRLGYGLLNEDKADDALAIFKLNTEEFPKFANTYDSYGDVLLVKGDSLQALENFKKCYAMDSSLQCAKDKTQALEAALKTK